MDVFVARQPIFDRESRVYAYELLYRSSASCNEYTGADAEATTLEVIARSILSIGLDTIVSGKKAFINFGRNLLLDGSVSMLPKESVVIEVLESVEPDSDVVKSCRRLREQGYTIALDDFVWHPRFAALAEIAHVIKVDLRTTSQAEQKRLIDTYRPRGVRMLAEKVETIEELDRARQTGYDYFQGYFFARPAIIAGREIPALFVTCLQVLNHLQRPEVDFKKLEELIAQDVALTYKLLRYVNSALFGHRANIDSIRRALMELGEDGIRRWVTIATLPRLAGNKPGELVACALIRARFGERLAQLARDPAYSAAYLVGLFSLLDALLDRPLEEALRDIGLTPALRDVLLGTAPVIETLPRVHHLVQSYETGQWETVQALTHELGLTAAEVCSAYVQSTQWVNEVLRGGHEYRKEAAPPAQRKVREPARKERRRKSRDPVGGRVTILWGKEPEQENIEQANLVDISVAGARFRVSTRIPAGSWLMFNHYKLGAGGRGMVRYCRLTKGLYEIGVEFSNGTGWDADSHRRSTELRNLHAAINRIHALETSAEAKVDLS